MLLTQSEKNRLDHREKDKKAWFYYQMVVMNHAFLLMNDITDRQYTYFLLEKRTFNNTKVLQKTHVTHLYYKNITIVIGL